MQRRAGGPCRKTTTLLFPLNVSNLSSGDLTGVAVLDMSDPANPVKTTTLVTPAMQSPHESMSLNHTRGLLAAVTANPVFYREAVPRLADDPAGKPVEDVRPIRDEIDRRVRELITEPVG